MDKQTILKAVKTAKEKSKKRKFMQKIDIIFNFKGLDLKKPEQQLDFYFQLPAGVGKKKKICAFIGAEMAETAKALDKAILIDEFDRYKDNKKLQKKLESEYDYFIAQANIMPKVAQVFGRVLGPKNKMPNPKAGCVVPANANLAVLNDRLQKTQRVLVKKALIFQCFVGTEESSDTDIVENINAIYEQVIHHLPGEKNNLKSIYVKLTMGEPIAIPIN